MSDWQAEAAARKANISAVLADMGITVESVFVPFSRSRNKAENNPSLNWRVTVKRAGREVLTTDYSAGMGHCPAKASKAPATYRARDRNRNDGKPYPGTTSSYRRANDAESLSDYLDEWRAAECETGIEMEYSLFVGEANFRPRRIREKGEAASRTIPILPDAVDVLYSLVMDSSVLDYRGFEDWTAEYGYDSDSRSAESIYRACLDLALKMRAAFGESGLSALQTAFQDY